jgi:hypothetical protein
MKFDLLPEERLMTNNYNGPKWDELLFWNNTASYLFPNNYDDSDWAAWVSRIQQGHDAEKVRLSELENAGYENNEAIDPHWRICTLSNNMYAALITAMWSQMERQLKHIIHISKKVLQSQNEKQKEYNFKNMKSFFKDKLSIDLESLSSYNTINAIRILNNSFKHHDSFYYPEPDKPYEQINPSLLQEWGIIKEEDNDENEIDFSKVPIKNLVLACANFCDELQDKVKQKFENKN